MIVSFNYKSNQTLEVWNGIFYSPDHDPELNRDPEFLANLDLPQIHPNNLISLESVGANGLLNIEGVLTYAADGSKVNINDFQTDGVTSLISSNEDSVLLSFSCKSITPSNFNNFNWEEGEKIGNKITMEHAFTYIIRASYRGQYSDNLFISGKIANTLPTCTPRIVFNGYEITEGCPQIDIDVESRSFTIRLTDIRDPEIPHYLENSILGGGSVVNLEVLRKLVMFRQVYGTNQQTIDSLDIEGFSLAATTSGTGKTFTLDLTYTLNTDVEVPSVNKIGLILIDPLDLQRPESTHIDDMGLYNYIPSILVVSVDASIPIVDLTAHDEYIEIKDVRYSGFNPMQAIVEKQPGVEWKPIDIPMTISLLNGANMVRIVPTIEESEHQHDWNKWSDPQEIFQVIDNYHGSPIEFEENCDIIDNNGMNEIDIVFRIIQKDYWNGDFNLSLNIESYKENSLQGQVNYVFPHVISIEPADSKILIL